MNKTIAYYNNNAEEFVSGTINADMSYCRDKFLQYVPDGGRILDAGCGSGRDTKAFLNLGYQVDAFDASEEVCKLASKITGIDVKCMRFDDFDGEFEYDGIWACASLLHVRSNDLPRIMEILCRLLKHDGVLYASFKYGTTERIKDDRFFCDMNETSLTDLIQNAGLLVTELFVTVDVRSDRLDEKWINVLARRAMSQTSS